MPTTKEPLLLQHAAGRLAVLQLHHRASRQAQHAQTQQEPGLLDTALLAEQLDWSAGPPPVQAADRDVQTEVGVTAATLQRLQLVHGMLCEVKSAGSQRGAVHVARILAVTAATAYQGAAPLSRLQGESSARDPLPPRSWQDGVAYLSPALAFNLGLHLHLERVLAPPAASAPPAKQGGCEPAPSMQAVSRTERVRVQPLRRFAADASAAGLASIPQSGRHAASVPIATKLGIRRVSIPLVSLLTNPEPLEPGPEGEGAAGAAGNAAKEQQAQASQAEDAAAQQQEEDQTVALLQQHFQATVRTLQLGDVFAIASHDHSGQMPLINALYGAALPAPELTYFRVDELEPQLGASLAIDFKVTSVMLEGSCGSALPVGLPRYLASSSQQPGASGATALMQQHTELLGCTVDAACVEPAALPQIGPLLPLWRQVAQLVAPLLHRGTLGMGLRLALLLHGPAGAGKRTALHAAAAALGIHAAPFNCHELKGDSGSKTAAALQAAVESVEPFAPCLLVLEHLQVLTGGGPGSTQAEQDATAMRLASALSDCVAACAAAPAAGAAAATQRPHPVILMACVPAASDLPGVLRRCFTHELEATAPDAASRRWLLQGMLGPALAAQLAPQALQDLADQTVGLLPQELRSLAADAACAAAAAGIKPQALLPAVEEPPEHQALLGAKQQLALKQSPAPTDLLIGSDSGSEAALHLDEQHITSALAAVQKRTSTVIGAPKVPDVRWEDVGGLEDVKAAILDTIELPLKHPTLFAAGLRRRSGVLLYGPPGTGKTLLAKAVATECRINFLSVKGPELINMYIGESERQIREVFARARRAAPCVLFFDELDSLAPARGGGADSGGVMDRVVAQLLAEVDSVQSGGNAGLFVVGATNRPDLLDSALLRPGRLDVLLYVGVAADAAARLRVLQALTRRFTLGPDVDLAAVAARCPATFTGADMYALCADAWMAGLRRTIAALEETDSDEAQDTQVLQEDFWDALYQLQPSLSTAELARYQALRDQYEAAGPRSAETQDAAGTEELEEEYPDPA